MRAILLLLVAVFSVVVLAADGDIAGENKDIWRNEEHFQANNLCRNNNSCKSWKRKDAETLIKKAENRGQVLSEDEKVLVMKKSCNHLGMLNDAQKELYRVMKEDDDWKDRVADWKLEEDGMSCCQLKKKGGKGGTEQCTFNLQIRINMNQYRSQHSNHKPVEEAGEPRQALSFNPSFEVSSSEGSSDGLHEDASTSAVGTPGSDEEPNAPVVPKAVESAEDGSDEEPNAPVVPKAVESAEDGSDEEPNATVVPKPVKSAEERAVLVPEPDHRGAKASASLSKVIKEFTTGTKEEALYIKLYRSSSGEIIMDVAHGDK